MSATVGEALTRTTAALAAAGIEAPRREARILVEHVLGQDGVAFTHPERPLSDDKGRVLAGFVARRAAREPWSRIIGQREFWSLNFRLSADTLDPRPDSETLIQATLDALPDRRAALSVLDLGTGSGCLLLALLSELPNATGLGTDISPGALTTAAQNAHDLGLANRARFIESDWGNSVTGRFDVILVNPPYIADRVIDTLEPEVAHWDPRRALAGGADGLDAICALAPDIQKLLSPQGLMAMEVGAGQDRAAEAILSEFALVTVARPTDLSNVVRCLLMRSTRTR